MSSKRWLVISGALIVSVALLGAGPSLEKEVTEIHLWWDQGQTFHLSTMDKIELVWRWGNCSTGLSQDWIAHTDIHVIIYDGDEMLREIAVEDGRWTDPVPSGQNDQCLHGDGTVWMTYWRYPLNLPPGDYRLESQISIDVALTDGGDYEPDGYLNLTPAGTIWEPEEVALVLTAGESVKTVCVVYEPGGANSFANLMTAEGLDRAASELRVDIATLDAETPEDLEPNILAFAEAGTCDLIMGVGFLAWPPMAGLVDLYPNQRFAILDPGFADEHDNLAVMQFLPEEAAFLAGYVAAGISETEAVGVFGGLPIEPVTRFMDGYALGVDWYNAQNGTSVAVLGWDPATQSGMFTFDFANPPLGQSVASGQYDAGAGIVFPVAGATGYGALDEAVERAGQGQLVYVIGVDYDWSAELGDPNAVILTSVVKDFGALAYLQIEALVEGSWQAGTFWEGLENGAVYIAPFHQVDDQVPQSIKDDLNAIREAITEGSIPTRP